MKGASLFRQRLPFCGLILSAITGILFAPVAPSWFFLSLTLLALGAWKLVPRAPWIYFACACAFASVHLWQTSESPAERFAESLRSSRLPVVAVGRVVSEPEAFGAVKSRLILRPHHLKGDGATLTPHFDVLVVFEGPLPSRNDEIQVTGTLQAIPGPRNPEAFDAKKWMRLQGIASEIHAAAREDVVVLKRAHGFSITKFADACRQWMEATLQTGISSDPVVGHLLAGMVLGVTKTIPEDLQNDFRRTGTFHLFSVSGLHVGMIAVILWQVFRLLGIRQGVAVACIIPALFFYALITGWKPSSLRAVVMGSVVLIGLLAARQSVPVNSLCAAGFLILAQSTRELFNPGFQLSFLVVLAILVIAPPVQERLKQMLRPDPFLPAKLWTRREAGLAGAGKLLAGSLAVSLAAWLGSLPLIILYFHMVSLVALPANLVIIPLAFVIMVTALLALTGGAIWGVLAAIFNNANWVFAHAMIGIIQSMSVWPGACFYVGPLRTPPAKITIFDCGPGAAVAVESDRVLWLLDVGSSYDARTVILPWIHSRGRAGADAILLTHGDARHVGGAEDLLALSPRTRILESPVDDRSPMRGRLHQRLAESSHPKTICFPGDRFQVGGASLKILFPPAGVDASQADDHAMVVRVDLLGSRMLYLSDAGLSTQQWLMKNSGADLRADVLVKGNHRSGVPMDADFLRAVSPEILVSSAAIFPKREMINEDWVSMVRGLGITLFRQDQTGAVELDVSKRILRARGFYDGREVVRLLPVRPAQYEP